MVLQAVDDAGLHVGGRREIERDPARGQLREELRVIDGAGSVGDARRLEHERRPDLRGATPLARVDGRSQTGTPGDGERSGMGREVRERGLGTREVEARQAAVDEARGDLRERGVGVGVV